jgi:hypothetical protein
VTPPTNVSEPPTGCPQRGKGCVALIIDYSKETTTEVDFQDVKANLEKVCVVKYVTPDIQTEPDSSDNSAAAQATRKHNNDEQTKINAAIAEHIKRLGFGTEIAIEMVMGHGLDVGGACGEVGAETGPGVKRAAFLTRIYTAVRRNTCAWFVADFTCYSGLTPEAFDDLNNSGKALCRAKPPAQCANHAAYEADIAVGTSSPTEGCRIFPYANLKRPVNNALEAMAGDYIPGRYAPLIDALRGLTSEFPAAYSDAGYKLCFPMTREGYWTR